MGYTKAEMDAEEEIYLSTVIDPRIKEFEDNLSKFLTMYKGKFEEVFSQSILTEFYDRYMKPFIQILEGDRRYYELYTKYFNDIIKAILNGNLEEAETLGLQSIAVQTECLGSYIEKEDMKSLESRKLQKCVLMYSKLYFWVLVRLPRIASGYKHTVEEEEEEDE
jgi:hypothetical protein